MLKKTMDEIEETHKQDLNKLLENQSIVILDNVRSAHNVGSIFRTSDCFGIKKVYLSGISSPIDNREVQKTALGAELSVPSEKVLDTLELVENLKESYEIVSVEQTKNSVYLNEFQWDVNKKYAFIFGNEVDGVDEQVIAQSHYVLEIPQVGIKHSLNVANSASIVLWDYFNFLNKG
jgi:23S rRNA (guanosine2251-2'-O)-methyltransferase